MLYEPTIFLTISFECFQIVKDRPEGGISSHKAPFAHAHSPMKELGDIVKEIKPTCLIGAAAIGGVFTEEILKDMASFNEKVGFRFVTSELAGSRAHTFFTSCGRSRRALELLLLVYGVVGDALALGVSKRS